MQVPFINLKAQYATIKDEIKPAIGEVLESQQFIMGSQVDKLEETIGDMTRCHAIAVASGSDALLLSLMAIGVGPGDEVITTPFTFFATAGAIARLRARPVFVDIQPDTFNIDPELIGCVCTDKTKAVIPVDLFGQCADVVFMWYVCQYSGIKMIEDAAQAWGASYGKEYEGVFEESLAGTEGEFGCFSFFPTKNLGGYGDGGMVLTNSPYRTGAIKTLRVHGARAKYHHEMIGINSRLDEIQAAVLNVKMKHIEEWTNRRIEIARTYDMILEGTPVVAPFVAPGNKHVYNQYVIRSQRRDELKECLQKAGISTAIYYPVPLHLQPCFSYLGYKEGDFPEAERACKEVLALPIYPEMSLEQVTYVCATIAEFYS